MTHVALDPDTTVRSAVGKVSLVRKVGLLGRDGQGHRCRWVGHGVQVLCSPVFSADKFIHKQMLKPH